jgi:hypothetical protein
MVYWCVFCLSEVGIYLAALAFAAPRNNAYRPWRATEPPRRRSRLRTPRLGFDDFHLDIPSHEDNEDPLA